MSNEFCLPVAVRVLPRKWVFAVLVVAHGLPLPIVVWVHAGVDVQLFGLPGWLWISAILAASLAWELRKQYFASNAKQLEVTTMNQWLLYGGAMGNKIRLINDFDGGWFILLLVAQGQYKYRLVIQSNRQPHDQLHRFRVLLRTRSTD